ncbi:MAG: formate/nitrite transporter family protein [Lentisphaeria bacterium]|nr:formate/nitrite transporter family protein [Lentisphaerota bacterium]MBR2626515.1 formate/nitrite transporter family protein [Lentisphaeria bacterium]
MFKKMLKTLLDAFFAGLFIGIAGTVYLCSSNAVIGAFLFGFGLLTIVCFSLKLYTGAIGYLAVQGKNFFRYLWELLLIWLGNFGGCFMVGFAIRHSRMLAAIEGKVQGIVNVKMADDALSLLILSIFCGMLMFTAVDAFRNEKLPSVCRPVMVFLCVMVFILSGFEHCIANMYYFSVANVLTGQSLLLILLMTLGNSIGGNLFAAMVKLSPALVEQVKNLPDTQAE